MAISVAIYKRLPVTQDTFGSILQRLPDSIRKFHGKCDVTATGLAISGLQKMSLLSAAAYICHPPET